MKPNDTSQEPRVLVVEDDFFIAKEIQRLLESIPMRPVGIAVDGLDAIEKVAQLEPDVVLMDIAMPRLDGLTAARRIQEVRPTPVVVLTAHETSELLEQASSAGVGAYLIKPPRADQIARAIVIAIARFADFQEMRSMADELKKRNQELQQALARIETLEGILPVCSVCKRIRDDQGQWIEVVQYITERSRATFTHSYCPQCHQKVFKDMDDMLNGPKRE